MLDPDLQKELKNAIKTAVVLHVAMVCEPVMYVIVALVLRQAGFDRGMAGQQPVVALMRSAFIVISVAVIPAIVFLRRALYTPQRIAPSGADTQRIGMLCSRAQLIIDAVAVVPVTLGFVFFLVDGSMGLLTALSVVSLVILAMIFPRYEMVEVAVMARMMHGETFQPISEESEGNA